MAIHLRVFLLALILLASPVLQIARCQSQSEEQGSQRDEAGGDLEIVSDEGPSYVDGGLSSASGVETVCVFPKNSARLIPAGEESELLVGIKNDGEASLDVVAIKATVHLPMNHEWLIQNLTAQGFRNASVPTKAQGTFPYTFAVSKFLQPGTYDLVGSIYYEINQQPYLSTFYNGTIEVVEAGGFLSMESVFLFTLAVALFILLLLWLQGRVQHLSKKAKKAPKVEVGTKTTDVSMDEWLQGTAFTQSLSNKSSSKKKK